VAEGSEYLEAREYAPMPGFDEDDRGPGARSYGPVRRFHAGHFSDRVGYLYYELLPEG
jgi:hypothetical protein